MSVMYIEMLNDVGVFGVGVFCSGVVVVYVLVLLLIVNVFNYVDCVLLGIVIELICKELFFNDIEIGIIFGLVFLVFFLFVGFGIVCWVDCGNCCMIFVFGLVLWLVVIVVMMFM